MGRKTDIKWTCCSKNAREAGDCLCRRIRAGRLALGEPGALPEWKKIERGVSSALILTESLRTLDRLRLRSNLSDAEVAGRFALITYYWSTRWKSSEIDAAVFRRAAPSMPTELGTLDAIHLATALLWRDAIRPKLVMATHDRALALGALAHGLAVVGVPQP